MKFETIGNDLWRQKNLGILLYLGFLLEHVANIWIFEFKKKPIKFRPFFHKNPMYVTQSNFQIKKCKNSPPKKHEVFIYLCERLILCEFIMQNTFVKSANHIKAQNEIKLSVPKKKYHLKYIVGSILKCCNTCHWPQYPMCKHLSD
jgi:hypothetical protein